MKDVQNQFDERNISLNEVGIKNLIYPVQIKDEEGNWITTRAEISCSVGLAGHQKGTHMSRFVEVIQSNDNKLNLNHIRDILEQMKEHLEAENSFLDIKFDYFVKKKSPVTENPSLLSVNVEVKAALIGEDLQFQVTVATPVTTLCPCSKEISEYSAHNQRALVSITANTTKFIPFEKFVEISENSASSPLYTLLKRPDEKYVTEYAYDHPRFVEDVCREAKQKVDELEGIHSYTIEVESYESIHNHSAYAKVVGGEDA